MHLVSNWRDILRTAWSVRFMILAAIFTALEVALPLLEGYLPIPPGVFAALSGFSSAAAFLSRFIAQKGLSKE